MIPPSLEFGDDILCVQLWLCVQQFGLFEANFLCMHTLKCSRMKAKVGVAGFSGHSNIAYIYKIEKKKNKGLN